MKKVSVQFNMEIDDTISHKDVKEHIMSNCSEYNSLFGKITSVQVNTVEKKVKK